MNHVYFVSYQFEGTSNPNCYGRCELTLKDAITSIDNIKEVEDYLRGKPLGPHTNVVVTNFILLRTY